MMIRLEIERPFERVTRGTRRSSSKRSAYDASDRTSSGSADPFESPVVTTSETSGTFSVYSSRSAQANAGKGEEKSRKREKRDRRREEWREKEADEKGSVSTTSTSSNVASRAFSQKALEVKAFFLHEPEIPIVKEMTRPPSALPSSSSSSAPHSPSVAMQTLNPGLGLGLGFGVDVPVERDFMSDGEIEVVGVVNEGEDRWTAMEGALKECEREEEEEMVKNALRGREYSWAEKVQMG